MRIFITLVIAALFAHSAYAQSEFTYQGELKDNGNPVNAAKTLRFELYDDQNAGNLVESLGERQISIVDGIFTVTLSSTNTFATDLYLQITVIEGTDQPLSPRQRITFAPRSVYSLNTRGIHVTPAGLVGINTSQPSSQLEIKAISTLDEALRLTRANVPTTTSFLIQSTSAVVQVKDPNLNRGLTLRLNPDGGAVRFGPDGIRFADNSGISSVPAPNLVGFVGSDTINVASLLMSGGSSISVIAFIADAMPGDIVIVNADRQLNRQFVLHNALVTAPGQVSARILNANTDSDAIVTDTLDEVNVTFIVLRF